MFRCKDCGATFKYAATIKEYHSEVSEFGYTPFEEFEVCPHCESADFAEWDGEEECKNCAYYDDEMKCCTKEGENEEPVEEYEWCKDWLWVEEN